MARITLPHMDWVRTKDPRHYEQMKAVEDALNNMAAQTNASPVGSTAAPQSISALTVKVPQAGLFDFQIQDNSPVNRGIEYFIEYSTSPSFSAARVIHVGATRNHQEFLGAQTLYFRAYSQYQPSGPSSPVYFGSQTNPTAVNGGVIAATAVPLPSTGSGTASNNGTESGAGYGDIPVRGRLEANL